VINRGFRYRLAPTSEQEAAFWQFAGVTRLVYNLAWEQRRDWWRQFRAQTGRRIDFMSQGLELTKLRAEFDWIAAVHSTPLTYALRDLDSAFSAFFAGRGSFPTPRCKGVHESFRFKGSQTGIRKLSERWSAVRVPKIGWVKFRDTRPVAGGVRNMLVKHSADGWHVVFSCEIEHEAEPSLLPAVGIDRGVANTIALSTGELLSTPATSGLERRKRRAQRILARRQRGSARYRKQRERVAHIAAKIARVRADWRHKATLDIARRFGAIAIEDLKTANMTRGGPHKRGLNRSILEQGWRAFETVLAYKLEERGGSLVKVNPAYTSQECSACGTIDKASRESQSRFACGHCGFAGHADTNAAINILRRSTASMRAEGAHCGPVETRTVNHALAA
jgi:putative transposase